jgi:hypothetical protein
MTNHLTEAIAMLESFIGTEDEGANDQSILAMLNEAHRPARPAFPVETFDGTCPNCGATNGSIMAASKATHVWGGAQVIDGVLSFDGEFDFLDDSTDEHLYCYECDAEWAQPTKVDYR